MSKHLARRAAVGLALGALAASPIVSVPAPAHAAAAGLVDAIPYVWEYNGGCTLTVDSSSGQGVKSLTDNGVPVSTSMSQSVTSQHGLDVEDSVVVTVSSRGTAKLTPIRRGPATFTFSASAAAKVAPRPSTQCRPQASGGASAGAYFVLPVAMWATLTVSGAGNGMGEVEIGSLNTIASLTVMGRAKSSTRVLLPAGKAEVLGSIGAFALVDDGIHSMSTAHTGAIRVDLVPVGSASAAAGKAKGHVALGNRDCRSGAIAGSLTKKAAKKAKAVVVTVNGAKVASFKGKKLKKRSFALRAAPSAAAEVVATVELKNGKKITLTRSYLACS